MKKYLILLSLILTNCAYVSYDLSSVKPNEVGMDLELKGRIFEADCVGNSETTKQQVKKECLEKISQTVFENGYSYFSVLDKDNSSKTSLNTINNVTPTTSSYYSPTMGWQTNTSYNSSVNYYTSTSYNDKYLFVLINEDELKKWPNYYIVSDYYPPIEN